MTAGVLTLADGRPLSARLMNWFARNVPVLNTFRVAAMRRELVNPTNRHRALHDAIAAAPDATHATATRVEFEAVADALRQGTRATVQEASPDQTRLAVPAQRGRHASASMARRP